MEQCMNDTELVCQDEDRREVVRASKTLNGLDYLEVSDDMRTLIVHFLAKLKTKLTKANIRISGGQRIRDIQVVDVQVCRHADPEMGDCMEVTVDKVGDLSTYTLCIVASQDGRPTHQLHPDFDRRYACLEFTFQAGCSSDLDCKAPAVCPIEPRVEPEIDTLAKDYASFRQLILDRLSLIMPDWQERHVPDVGIALVELLAYVGDHLSYTQDAVATEAYLDTARQRISARRHVRLVDYYLHEGNNARAWVFVWTRPNPPPLKPTDFYFVTGYDGAPTDRWMLTRDDLRSVPAGSYEVFEPLVADPGQPIQLYEAHNKIGFYTWGDDECCLLRGATAATLRDEYEKVDAPAPSPEQKDPLVVKSDRPVARTPKRKLNLRPGDLVLFEEIIGPKTGNPADADPTHRHVVRLTKVTQALDKLYEPPVPIVEIEWAAEDALPFPLCISAIGPAPECELIEDISVARGNILLVDHGQTLPEESLGSVPLKDTVEHCEGEDSPAEVVEIPGTFRPTLQKMPLTFSQPMAARSLVRGAASGLLSQNPRKALPEAKLRSAPALSGDPWWTARYDLLGSGPDDQNFVAEIDDEGRAHLRFGDGELGRMPPADTAFYATYRVGNGPSGNVGAGTIVCIVLKNTLNGVDLRPRNPLPARGGTAPEPLADVKLLAPYAFRDDLQRAITPGDYATLAERNPKVQKAAAALRWMGSWYEALAAIDPVGKEGADNKLLREIARYLRPYKRMGHDLAVKPAQYVSLDIKLTVCVLSDYLRGHVKAALLDLFSNRRLADGRLGFFHPDALTFGEGVMLSKLVALARSAPGVEDVQVNRLQRYKEAPNHEIENGILPLGPLEIARLDNDPNLPENGVLELEMEGGR